MPGVWSIAEKQGKCDPITGIEDFWPTQNYAYKSFRLMLKNEANFYLGEVLVLSRAILL